MNLRNMKMPFSLTIGSTYIPRVHQRVPVSSPNLSTREICADAIARGWNDSDVSIIVKNLTSKPEKV